jgi:hypothetical protein
LKSLPRRIVTEIPWSSRSVARLNLISAERRSGAPALVKLPGSAKRGALGTSVIHQMRTAYFIGVSVVSS